MRDMSSRSARQILLGQDNNALVLLFAINMLVFLMINFIKIVYFISDTPQELFYRQILHWFTLPATTDIYWGRPWTLISYMFTHHTIWHLISSMLWLWCFGYILQDLAGNKKLIPIYLYGGLAAAIVFLVGYNTFPSLMPLAASVAPLLGAGASVMAIAAATTALAPNYRLFPLIGGGIPLWVLTAVYMLIDIGSIGSSLWILRVGHILAAAIGYLYIQQLQRGNDWGAWMVSLVNWVNDWFNPSPSEKKRSYTQEDVFRINNPPPYERIPKITQQKLDAILDKINQKGIDHLTEEEKEFLRKASE
ncbi:MAG: rhomboid family intramembrane serine protease [Chitinophagia bacterium]|nr:rhomboid family intramembrane serine protease [Chitinophagia bacterium]